MLITADIFGDYANIQKGSKQFANSALSITSLLFDVNLLIQFLVPIYIGGSLYSDYKCNVFMITYSYPIIKPHYLFGKFISAFSILLLIALFLILGIFFGTTLSSVNPNLIGPHNLLAYVTPLVFIAIPNMLVISMLVFSVVLFSRNIYSGFVATILLILTRQLLLFIFGGPDNQALASLFDPFAEIPVFLAAQYWSIDQINTSNIPIESTFIFNRLMWIGSSVILFVWTYRKFTFSQTFGFKKTTKHISNKKKSDKPAIVKGTSVPINLNFDFSFLSQLKAMFNMSVFEFKSVLSSKLFLTLFIGSIIFMYLLLAQANPQYTTRIYPLTQVILMVPSIFFNFIIGLIIFLYAGILIQKDRTANINQLIDTSPIPSWTLLGSKFLALLKIQVILLSVIMFVGILVQTIRGYHNYEIGFYIFDLYAVSFISLIIWAMLAFFIQSVLTNQYVGLFILIMFSTGVDNLDSIGLKLDIFKYNMAPVTEYSDFFGYSQQIYSYFAHKLYWLLLGALLLIGSLLFWVRGLTESFIERIKLEIVRCSKPTILTICVFLFAFLSTGFAIYHYVYPPKSNLSKEALLLHKANTEKNYGALNSIIQPRLSGVKILMDLFPESRDYTSTGVLTFINKSKKTIDTLIVSYPAKTTSEYSLKREFQLIKRDSILNFDIVKLNQPIVSGDSILLHFSTSSIPSTFFISNSQVKENGTFLLADLFSMGLPDFLIKDRDERKKHDLPTLTKIYVSPASPHAPKNSYVGKNVDLFDFEATVSTSIDQVALAPGKLIEQWTENDRSYFRYKSNNKIRNGIVFNSGKFEVKKERFNNIDLEIYYHKTHAFNLDRMMKSMKVTLAFAEENYAPYQFEQMRIIEFPKTYGNFAQSFANTIPYSEFAGFISKEDTTNSNRFDQVFRLVAHEMAHQWWGHQVVPSDALGSRVITEGLAEYTSIKILEQEYGNDAKQLYLDLITDRYLRIRSSSQNSNTPLALARPNQSYLNYHKAALTFYALEDIIGEDAFWGGLQNFIKQFGLQSAPYSTSLDLSNTLKEATDHSSNKIIYNYLESDSSGIDAILLDKRSQSE